MVSSRKMADAVGDALGLPRESAQLHLKTIRAAGKITFTAYGRAAADMTALDASRMIIASAGSYFAKDSALVLDRFAGLTTITKRTRRIMTLEDCLAERIAELPMDAEPPDHVTTDRPREWHNRFKSPQLAKTALQLLDPMPRTDGADERSRYAVLRWLNKRGNGEVLIFGPSDAAKLGRGTEIFDLLELNSSQHFFQVRIVRRQALIEIAAALKGIPTSSGNSYGNAG